ncbi:MAG: HlyD family type I secretion periplasmic adaptor subunit [Pseudomonadota bacterium]|nr:HlyD family type I secretion periplasmic adaptor subunit [Pseudomonadota bacterium]
MTSDYWRQLQQAYRARQVVWLLGACVLSAIVWASLATLDEVVVGEGKLVPAASVQKIQSLDGGILRELHVSEGEGVRAGDLLVTLDATRAQASHAEALAEQATLQSKQARLLAELRAIHNDQLHDSAHTQTLADALPANEQANFFADLNELKRRLNKASESIIQQQRQMAEAEENSQTLAQSLVLLDQELELTRRAVETGALSAAELRKLERERVRVAGQLAAEKINYGKLQSVAAESRQARQLLFDEFRRKTRDTLSDTDARLVRLEQILKGLASQLEQTRLFAVMDGTVKSIELPSLGGVIKPGDTIMEIVPANDRLLVESRIAPKDIAHLQVGQSAVVKFSAYDFVIFGGLKGKLINISPDAITNERGESFFLAQVQADEQELDPGAGRWRDKPLIPGMQAQVDILAGRKTVLTYWLKPLLRARANAMREP